MSEIIHQINTLFINISTLKNQLQYMKKILTLMPENDEVKHETELELKRVRRMFETTTLGSTLFPFGTEYVYVWELEDDKYYIGWSENLSRRLDEHITEEGSLWTKKYNPIGILEIVRGDKQLERLKTLHYMKKKGFDNVRGSVWCAVEYKTVPFEVQKFLIKDVQG
jgi:predicted GIY-YIG superfamily endonuclease